MKVFSGDIRILGPRPSGKLTFLAALACFPQAGNRNSAVLSIEPINAEAQQLVDIGNNILGNGAMVPPMDYPQNPVDCPFYALQIIIKPKLNLINALSRKNTKLLFSCRAYAGEFFDSLLNSTELQHCRDYLDDLVTVNQFILMIDATSSKRDQEYAYTISILEKELNSRVTTQENMNYKKNYRIAVVFSKFDRAPAYNYRYKLDEFINFKFPKVYSNLESWRKGWNCSISYFACSAFGMVSNPPKPNAAGNGSWDTLKEPDSWKPFGLVSPIYWLLTEKYDHRLSYDF